MESVLKSLVKLFIFGDNMKYDIISDIKIQMKPYLNQNQLMNLTKVLKDVFSDIDVSKSESIDEFDNFELLDSFLVAKKVEGCSNNTLIYYRSTLEKMLHDVDKPVDNIQTDDLRNYLSQHKENRNSSKTTIDNIRRIFSSFFSWLEYEDYIIKNPVKRIRRVKTPRLVKDILSDEFGDVV